jgi:hypothetical protein
MELEQRSSFTAERHTGISVINNRRLGYGRILKVGERVCERASDMSAHIVQKLSIREQTVEDPVSGFVFKFAFVSGSENPSRVLFRKNGDTFWREYGFDAHGNFGGATTRAAADAAIQPALRLVK